MFERKSEVKIFRATRFVMFSFALLSFAFPFVICFPNKFTSSSVALSKSLQQVTISVQPGAVISSECLTRGGSASKLTHEVVGSCWFSAPCRLLDWRSQFYMGCGRRLSLVPCHLGLSIGQLTRGSWLPSEWICKRHQERERIQTREQFQSLITTSDVTSCLFCYTLFIRRKLISAACTRGEGITQDIHNVLRVGSHWQPFLKAS